MLDILEVEADFLRKGKIRAAGNLRETSNPGPHGEDAPLMRLIELHLFGEVRPRANERQMASKDIEELWELIERPAAENATHPRDTWVIAHFEEWSIAAMAKGGNSFPPTISIPRHRPKLEHRNFPPPLRPHTLRDVENRTARVENDDEGEKSEEGKQCSEEESTENNITSALPDAAPPIERRGLVAEERQETKVLDCEMMGGIRKDGWEAGIATMLTPTVVDELLCFFTSRMRVRVEDDI